MDLTTRASRVSAAFVRIAETLVDEYDVLDLLHTLVDECVGLLDACVDCYVTGVPVTIRDIAGTEDRWPEFKDAAAAQGFKSVHAFPMRVRVRTIGAMNLFRTETGEMSDEDIVIGQALADVSTISILRERIISESVVVNDQLQRALNSRILIEPAKGMIAHISNVDTIEAFQRIRLHARAHNTSLRETAQAILNRSLTL